MKIAFINSKNPKFPLLSYAQKDEKGLLCAGGNLDNSTLLKAYSKGIFPWYNVGQPILWWSPDPRMILFPEDIHISKSMTKFKKKSNYSITWNKDFPATIHACAEARNEGTWVHEDMINAYISLHKNRHAHSIEVWDGSNLCGGLYGVAIGKVFFGESMFSFVNNASKLALIFLAQSGLYKLIDCQYHTDHLERMGAKLIPRKEYIKLLNCFL